VVLRS